MAETKSPFHRGERKLQSLVGVRDQMENFGRRVIRDYLPEQHREFYKNQNYLFLGHVDPDGWPWASMMFSPKSFIDSPNENSLSLNIKPMLGDPLGSSLKEQLEVGILGIELHSRRRNRLSVAVSSLQDDNIELEVRQSFGNCPQYIQERHWQAEPKQRAAAKVEAFQNLDLEARQLIANSDTFFVASYAQTNESIASNGADISHRGGKSGFVRVDENNLLTIPDFVGNFHFNTLGNFLENPKAGLLFVDFKQGHVLQLTGTTEVLFTSNELEHYDGAERLWTFKTVYGRWLRNCLPKSWRIESESPNNRLTGTWVEAEKQRRATNHAKQWQTVELSKVITESDRVSSFYFSPLVGQVLSRSQAGQFLTLRAELNGKIVSRCYTISSAPDDNFYRISVKRDGTFSTYLHRQLQLGQSLEVLPPQGEFTMDASDVSTALLLAAGIGITPMLSFIRDSLNEAIRSRYQRNIILLVQLKYRSDQSFYTELEAYQQASQGKIKVYWLFSQETSIELKDNEFSGRINRGFLNRIIDVSQMQSFLCGPKAFMQGTYQLLTETGFSDKQIFSEAFGPGSLIKTSDKVVKEALSASVKFLKDGAELSHNLWQNSDGNLLDFAEQHGLNPEFSCRSGRCGSCRAKLLEGQVSYGGAAVAAHQDDEVLLCCAKPAKGTDSLQIELVS